MPPDDFVKLALVDDHKLFRKGLISLIQMVDSSYNILFEADNGIELQNKMGKGELPNLILMDVNMPGMDGFDSVKWLNQHYPEVRVLIVSMIEKEEVIVKMLKLGVKGYLCKDVEPKELGEALQSIINKGFYYTDFITGKLVHSLQNATTPPQLLPGFDEMNDREQEFIKLACSDMTYHQIADKMCLSPKTIDGYRSALFGKLKVKSRVGLVLHAVKHGWVKV